MFLNTVLVKYWLRPITKALTDDCKVAVCDDEDAEQVQRPIQVGVDDVLHGGQAALHVDVDEAPRARILQGVLPHSEQRHGAKQHAEQPDAKKQ